MGVVVPLALFLLLCPVFGFEAFDCMSKRTSTGVYDAREPEACPDPKEAYHPPEQKRVQVCQELEEHPVNVLGCRVHVSRQVTRCGTDSLTYGSRWVEFETPVFLTPDECRIAYETKTLTMEGRSYPIEVNKTMQWSSITRGEVRDDGWCQGVSYWRNNVEYRKTYEDSQFNVEIGMSVGRASYADNNIVIKNQIRSRYSDLITRDSATGLFLWNRVEVVCNQALATVFTTNASLHLPKDPSANKPLVLVADHEVERFLGFVLGESIPLCGRTLKRTQVAGVLILYLDIHDTPIPTSDPGLNLVSLRKDINSRMAYLHVSTHLHLEKAFNQVANGLCELSRNLISTQLGLITSSPNSRTSQLIWGPGTKARMIGSAVYVTKCESVEVRRRDHLNCTKEVPVYHGEVKKFMDPNTRELLDFGTIIPCDPSSPAMWFIGSKWYCSTPSIHRCEPPKPIRPQNHSEIRWDIDSNELGGGMYTAEQWKMHEESMRYDNTRDSVISNVTMERVNMRELEHSTSGLLTGWDIPNLKKVIASALSPVYVLFGEWSYFVVSFVLISGLIQTAVLITYRTYLSWSVHGCTWRLFTAISSEMFHLFYLPARIISSLYKEFRDPPNQVQDVEEPEDDPPAVEMLQVRRSDRERDNDERQSFNLF